VRIVSATCAPLLERISEGTFRHDLYHRLSTLVIDLPPLRKRTEDIPALAESYLEKIAPEVGRKHLLPASIDALRRAPWPGNIRELFGVLYRAAALTPGDSLSPGHLMVDPAVGLKRPRLLADKARELLDIHGSASAAARAAGVPRTTFRSVLERDKARRAQ
jgi:DNA-binding NtrC family response regulator